MLPYSVFVNKQLVCTCDSYDEACVVADRFILCAKNDVPGHIVTASNSVIDFSDFTSVHISIAHIKWIK